MNARLAPELRESLIADFRQILAGLGVANANTLNVQALDLGNEFNDPDMPGPALDLFANGETKYGFGSFSLAAHSDGGGYFNFNIYAEGGNRAQMSVPFLPNRLAPEDMVQFVTRQVNHQTWLYRRTVEAERHQGIRS